MLAPWPACKVCEGKDHNYLSPLRSCDHRRASPGPVTVRGGQGPPCPRPPVLCRLQEQLSVQPGQGSVGAPPRHSHHFGLPRGPPRACPRAHRGCEGLPCNSPRQAGCQATSPSCHGQWGQEAGRRRSETPGRQRSKARLSLSSPAFTPHPRFHFICSSCWGGEARWLQ